MTAALHAIRPQVLVAGGGPVGLAGANLLASYGVSVMLVERNASTSDEPKAVSVDDESLRTLELAGLGAEIERIITPGTGTSYFGANGHPLFRTRSSLPFRLGHPFKNPFAQPEFERVLRDALERRSGATVRFGSELVEFEGRDDRVDVVVRDVAEGITETGACDYLLACDGGRSMVRERLEVRMTGRSYQQPWLVVDVLDDAHRERYGLHYGVPERPTVIVPGAHGRCRYEFRLNRAEGAPGQPPSFDLLVRLLAPYRRITPDQVERAVVYRFNALLADRWQVGRVLLAGDAAHMMPPFAGQGLNSGMRDVNNVAWKIADVLSGRLSAAQLTTYERERRPHAEQTVKMSEWLGHVIFTTSRRRALMRDVIVRGAMHMGFVRTYLEEMRYRPTTTIRDGLVIPDPDGPSPVGSAIDQPWVFDVTAHRKALLDEVIGSRWALLGIAVSAGDWDRISDGPLSHLADVRVDISLDDHTPDPAFGRRSITDLNGGLQRSFAASRHRFLLIRPDRVVAASFPSGAAAAVERAIADWLPSGAFAHGLAAAPPVAAGAASA